jgi:hypothetical protein
MVSYEYHRPGLRLFQPGDPTDRLSVSSPLFCLKTEAESSFRNVVVLLFYNLDDGKLEWEIEVVASYSKLSAF